MKKNKLLVFVLAIIIVSALVACNSDDNRSGAAAAEIVDDNGNGYENDLNVLEVEGTVVAILDGELLFVGQLNLSQEQLERTADEWFDSDDQPYLYRLTDNGSDISVGTEIRISFAVTTMSIPPLVPEWEYEII